ncbi:hypothetical protein Dfulv_36095 [Dactylosporangium fulvum]|uniref:Electron transfer flavoprotein subunit alpha n=1 Tax=Dactylosporangium fulvum TaxID=53359 RepID=A0ABY5VUN0_9ACTN|nr:hypothetical protein [Dactylosporangium fulvum]UWP80551.1 hypothetical protein Dfulv_36095 [Dactylosporangium fulvum]
MRVMVMTKDDAADEGNADFARTVDADALAKSEQLLDPASD